MGVLVLRCVYVSLPCQFSPPTLPAPTQLVVFYPKTEKYVGVLAAQEGQGEGDAKTKQRCVLDSCF